MIHGFACVQADQLRPLCWPPTVLGVSSMRDVCGEALTIIAFDSLSTPEPPYDLAKDQLQSQMSQALDSEKAVALGFGVLMRLLLPAGNLKRHAC